MKKIFLLSFLLVACAGDQPEPTPAPAETQAAAPLPEATPPASNDSGLLATPVEPAKDVPKVEATATPAPEAAPIPPPAQSAALPAPAKAKEPPKDIYEQYEEYRKNTDARTEAETEFNRRSYFAHEDGAFQLGIDYAYQPFDGYNVNKNGTKASINSTGGALSFGYFPVRSMSYGRFGLVGVGGFYLGKYEFVSNTGAIDTTRKPAFLTYGGRAVYEFQYWLAQMFVPFAFYGYDQVKYQGYTSAAAGVSYPKDSFDSKNYGGGFHLNLNRLEPTVASKALVSSGVRKFYLTYTFLQRDKIPQGSHYLGLRFEY